MFDTEPVDLYRGDHERVFVHILETRNDYPATYDTAQPRILLKGAITTMTLQDAAEMVRLGRAEYF